MPTDLYSHTDLDLGTRQLRRLRYHDGRRWSRAALVANMVEYQPDAPNRWAIHKFISRIKAEEQIWNKVVDTIFGLDRLVRADKQLRHLGRFVKDVFGVKAVVSDPEQARALHAALRRGAWTSSILEAHGVPMSDATRAHGVHRGQGLHGAMGPQGDRVGGDQVGVPLVGHDDRGPGAAALRTFTASARR